MTDITWHWQHFAELGPADLYDILVIRQRVFIVEQHCAYLDADGEDPSALHLCGRTTDAMLAAYLRLLPPGRRFTGPSIGRVVTAPEVRRSGIGRLLMMEGIWKAREVYPGQPLYVSAQRYLEGFYFSLGFVTQGHPKMEDGIPHIAMMRPPR